MTHALADVVHIEQFVAYTTIANRLVINCPDPACPWLGLGADSATIGEQLAAARAHIAEAHTAAPDYADSYPALIPEAQLACDETTAAVRVCDATGNTVRGPLLPVELDGRRLWLCRVCFAAYRRSVSHLDDPLPLSEGPVL